MEKPTEKENCFSCKNCISKHYVTIRCAIWTPKIQEWLKDDKVAGRIWHTMRCQHYERR